jgi:3D-(3,5/4)-trihydroxycyclohexane-1,2-dione acylhydrolase (decyclizing)
MSEATTTRPRPSSAALGDRGTTVRLTMAQALVRFLVAQYSERDGERRRLIAAAFGIFGHGNVAGIGQALLEEGDRLPFYQPFNEQNMVHTASGYAKELNRRSTLACAASIGPGSTNMLTGAATATINRLPVLLLASDYYATRRQGPVLQQLEHPSELDTSVNDCFRPVSRFFDRITRPEQLLESLPEAMRVLTDPVETGTVTLSLPQDIQAEAFDYPEAFFRERVWTIERRPPTSAAIRAAAALLRDAERPFIIAGGGVHYSEAWAELKEFSEALGIPVGETFVGRGAVRDESPLLLGGVGATGNPAAAAIAAEADVVIAIGTRLTDFTTGSRSLFQHPDVRFLAINVCGKDAIKLGAEAVVADAREALVSLTAAARDAGVRPDDQYLDEVAAARGRWRERLETETFVQTPGMRLRQAQCIGLVNRQARPGDVIIGAAGSVPGDLHQMWDATGGRRAHLEFGYSCMGYELPAGLGVRMSGASGEVYVMIGDGTFLMSPSELATAVQEGLKVTVLLMDNHGYQVIRRLQMATVGTSYGLEFRNRGGGSKEWDGEYLELDFPKLAEGFGARAWHVENEAELAQALLEARAETRSCLIHVEIEMHEFGPSSEVWWDVAPAEVSSDDETRRLRAAYEEGRESQRYYG